MILPQQIYFIIQQLPWPQATSVLQIECRFLFYAHFMLEIA